MAQKPRRVVTGCDASGSSCFARVEEVDEVDYPYVLPPTPSEWSSPDTAGAHGSGGGGFYRIWASDRLPIPLPTDGKAPFLEWEPSAEETPQALRRTSILPPPLGVRIGLSVSPNTGPPGRMHWTDSTDILFLMSGKHGQILDEGEVLMHPGDVLVQNGTNHSHQTIEGTTMGFITLSALRTGPHPSLDLLNPVSGPIEGYLGGYRPAESRDKQPIAPWQVAGATPRPYPDEARPSRLEDVVNPRRVVTGTNGAGNAYFARVEECGEVDYDALGLPAVPRIWRIWGTDRLPDFLPVDGLSAPLASRPTPQETPEALRRAPLLPGPLGVVTTICAFPPSDSPGPLGWHDSMDASFVMAGELTHILDSGEEVTLRPGDVLIQNGTNHAWHNRGSSEAWLGTASFGAVRLGATPPLEHLHPIQRQP